MEGTGRGEAALLGERRRGEEITCAPLAKFGIARHDKAFQRVRSSTFNVVMGAGLGMPCLMLWE
jgi:hypothetical protein